MSPAKRKRGKRGRRYGYNPHAFRHLRRGLASNDASKRYCDSHGIDSERRDIMGRMALDHDLDGLDALYTDDDSDAGRERGNRK